MFPAPDLRNVRRRVCPKIIKLHHQTYQALVLSTSLYNLSVVPHEHLLSASSREVLTWRPSFFGTSSPAPVTGTVTCWTFYLKRFIATQDEQVSVQIWQFSFLKILEAIWNTFPLKFVAFAQVVKNPSTIMLWPTWQLNRDIVSISWQIKTLSQKKFRQSQ